MARTGFAVALVAAFVLSACSDAGGPQAEAELASTEQTVPVAPLAPYSGVAVAPAVDVDPDQLIGLSGGDVTRKLGTPALIRRDGEAEVWQYRRARCVLDLFLYGSLKQVEHVDLRDRGDATDAAVRDCFARMLEDGPASS